MNGTAAAITRVHPPAPTSLEPSETNDDRCLPSQTAWQAGMHGKDHFPRLRIAAALNTSPNPQLQKRARRIAECCAHPLICRTDTGETAIAPGRCRDRLCPRCARLHGHALARTVERCIRSMNSPRFITLTRTHDHSDLAAALTDLMQSFRRLRAQREWKSHVAAGVATIEVTRNRRTHTWHVHVHAVIDGTFWAQAELSKAWKVASGGSMIVDIRACHDRRAAARYIATYIAKAPDIKDWPPSLVCEFAEGMHGRRLLLTVGGLHGGTPTERDDQQRPRLVEVLCSVDRLHHAAALGSPTALQALAYLARVDHRLVVAPRTMRGNVPGERDPLTAAESADLAQLCRSIGDNVYGIPDPACTHDRQRQNVLAEVTTVPLFPE